MIVFPMAGLSSRFNDAGYYPQKFQLPIWNGYVFDFAVSSFEERFQSETFMFIYRETGDIERFLEERVAVLGIKDAVLIELKSQTSGQAETVEHGLEIMGVEEDTPITIFNIDTFRRPGTLRIPDRKDLSGFLEVFEGQGDNWSFALPHSEDRELVKRTAEKVAISQFCSNGLYHFASTTIFKRSLERERVKPSAVELYIAPIYNHIIREGHLIGLVMIPAHDLRFCGVPDEYKFLCSQPVPWQLAYQTKK